MRKRVLVGGIALLLVALLAASCGNGVSQEAYDEVLSDLEEAQQELAATQATLTETQSDLNALQEIYPPGDFATVSELESWLASQLQPTTYYVDEAFRAALRVQAAALQDGYLISVDIDYDAIEDMYYVWCNAIAANLLYMWSPEQGIIYPYGMDFRR